MRSAACVVLGALGLFVGGCGAERGRASVSPSGRAEAASAQEIDAATTLEVPVGGALSSSSSAELEAATMQTTDAAWKAHDAEKLGSAYAADARVAFPGFPDAKGRQAVEEAARSFWAEFPDAKHAWSRTWRTPGVAIVESAWTGTNTGPLEETKPTLRAADGIALTLTWFAPDGLVREQHIYSDAAKVEIELGRIHGKGRTFEGLPTSHEEHSATGTVVEQANLELVKGGVLHATEGDWKAFLAWTAEDVEYVDFTQPGSWKGRAAAEKWFHTLRTIPSGSVEVALNAWGIEDYVIREYAAAPFEVDDEFTGGKPRTHPSRAPESKGPHRSSGVEVLQIREGKLVRVWGYANALETAPHAT
jgi:ketosteroid isomerase-like protein